MGTSSLNSIDMFSNSWKEMEAQTTDRNHTDIRAISSEVNEDGNVAEIVVRNAGNTSLAQFERWDVIVIYGEGDVQWLPYRQTAPGWSLAGISFQGVPEIFEPDILNPGEEMRIVSKLSPSVSENITNLATISTLNGVKTQITFRR
jgi:hypothetical protein